MTSSWHLLPREILIIVLRHFVNESTTDGGASNKAVLLQLQLVCKSWADAARPFLYKYHQFFLTLETAKLLYPVLQQPGNTTKELLQNIKVTDELANDPLFVKIIQQCRNLTELSAEAPKTYDSSMYFTNFFTILFDLVQGCHLPRLKKVEYPLWLLQSNRILDHQRKAMLQLSNTLTSLHILESCVGKHSFPLQFFVEWFSLLKQFPRLQHVTIQLASLSYLYEMERFINQLGRNISSVNIALDNFQMLQPLRPVSRQDTSPHAPLRHLKISLSALYLQDLAYIMYKFGRISKSFTLNSTCASTFNLETTQSRKLMKAFFEYVRRMPKYSVNILQIPNSCLRHMLRCMSKWHRIKALHIQVVQGPTNRSVNAKICGSLSKAVNRRRKAHLTLVLGRNGIITLLSFVYELLKNDIKCLTFDESLQQPGISNVPVKSCKVEKAVELAVNSLPLLKRLTATNAALLSLASIMKHPAVPKLSFDHLSLGSHVSSKVYYELSQRIKYIGRFLQPYVENVYYQHMRQLVLDMSYTVFGEIHIVSTSMPRCIVKICTRSNIVYQGIVFNEGLSVPTEDDYDTIQAQDDHIGKITIYCTDIKMLKVGTATIRFQNGNIVSVCY